MMKKTIGTIAVLALGVALIPSAARAACALPVTFGQNSGGHAGCGGGYCYVTSGGVRTNASIQGNFWGVGAGNPAIGPGVDNGNQGNLDWMPDQGFGGGVGLKGDWLVGPSGNPDGCIDTLGAGGAMAIGLSDIDGSAATGFFAAACVTRDGTAVTEFDYTKIVPESHIDLKPIPKPVISSSTRIGENTQVTIAPPNFDSIYYSDGSPSCAINNVITRYDVWVQQTTRGGAAPTDRNTAAAWVLGATCAAGQPCNVTVPCAGGPGSSCDAFFAVSPKFDGANVVPANAGFGTGRVSPNSFRTHSGSNVATPPKPKTIKKMDSGVRPQ
jgi:hypothetical protein